MAHTVVNGITIATQADTVRETPEHVGEIGARGVNGEYFETKVARKGVWKTRVNFQLSSMGLAIRSLLEADGVHMPFDDNAYTTSGAAPEVGGSYTIGATGQWGNKINVGSSSFIEWALASRMFVGSGWDPTLGWTLMVYKKLSVGDGASGTTFHHHIATGSVAVVRGAAANPGGVTQYKDGAAGSWSMGNWIDVGADGLVGIYGKSNANGNAAYDYDELIVLPYEVDATWAAALYAFQTSRQWPAAGRVELSGDIVPAPVDVCARVPGIEQRNIRLAGAHRNNARVLDVLMHEV